MSDIHLITLASAGGHYSNDTVREFEKAILDDPRVRPVPAEHSVGASAAFLAWRCFSLLSRITDVPARWDFARFPEADASDGCFAVLMGPTVKKLLPRFLRKGRKSVYLFDAWPSVHGTIERIARTFGISHVFVSARQAVEQLRPRLGGSTVTWIPEGISPGEYRAAPYAGKNVDVLQFGRRLASYHEKIAGELLRDGRTYLYGVSKGYIIFPTREGFVDGLARTKISLCFPSTMTDPGRAGTVETMTARYLQSMVSKCLVVGRAPAELVELFGYNPVIEYDQIDPVGQLRTILRDYQNYIPLIERNFATIVAGHTWRHRWNVIAALVLGAGETEASR